MKSLKILITALAAVVLSGGLFAQTDGHSQMSASKTETLKVYGNCDMCKSRIEKAAKVEGVSSATWDKETKNLNYMYDPKVTSPEVIERSVVNSGHDTDKRKAEDTVYEGLPGCCKYARSK
ncbi:MAG: heavy-metal-associated domain-containing protein [Bacteroidales bacterium]|nr:heavy-metal-associated domain-containing protein [Bacteroidales bacterium]MCB8999775.1 heavy-metal-associated domain-containing protein [Bacteroidales bacterium]